MCLISICSVPCIDLILLHTCNSSYNTGDGIKYTGMCECMVSYAFFQEFSVRFAKAARGTIFYLGNGESENGAFSEESFFAKHEIPYLKSDLTPSAVILVVHDNTASRGTLTVNNLTSMNEVFHCTY